MVAFAALDCVASVCFSKRCHEGRDPRVKQLGTSVVREFPMP